MKEELEKLLNRMSELTKELEEVQNQIRKLCMQSEILGTMERSEETMAVTLETRGEVTRKEEEEVELNPQVFQFLDLYTMEEKLDYLKHTMEWKGITEKDLDVMAVSVDIVLKENEISAKIDDLIYCVEQLAQWEINGKRR